MLEFISTSVYLKVVKNLFWSQRFFIYFIPLLFSFISLFFPFSLFASIFDFASYRILDRAAFWIALLQMPIYLPKLLHSLPLKTPHGRSSMVSYSVNGTKLNVAYSFSWSVTKPIVRQAGLELIETPEWSEILLLLEVIQLKKNLVFDENLILTIFDLLALWVVFLSRYVSQF